MSNNEPQIVKETVYNHKPYQMAMGREFSFLMDTHDNQDEAIPQQPDLNTFIQEIKRINENLTVRMDHMDRQLASEIEKHTERKKSLCLVNAARSIHPSNNLVGMHTENQQMFGYKQFLVENRLFETSSNFEIDEHQNFVKIKNGTSPPNFGQLNSNSKTRILPNINLTLMTRLHQQIEKQNNPLKRQQYTKERPLKESSQKRVYESILSKFSTANLIAMNREES